MHSNDPPESDNLGLTSETTVGATPRDVQKYIGMEIRRLRQRANITGAQLAAQTGLSKGMVSRIEHGSASASLTTLAALSDALSVPLSALFSILEERRDVSLVPANQTLEIDRGGTRRGHVYELLGHGVGGSVSVTPYLVTLRESAEAYTDFQHEGVEFIRMIKGEMVYRHGDRKFRLRPGDSLLFDSIAPHGPVELVDLPAQFLSIITYSRKDK